MDKHDRLLQIMGEAAEIMEGEVMMLVDPETDEVKVFAVGDGEQMHEMALGTGLEITLLKKPKAQ